MKLNILWWEKGLRVN